MWVLTVILILAHIAAALTILGIHDFYFFNRGWSFIVPGMIIFFLGIIIILFLVSGKSLALPPFYIHYIPGNPKKSDQTQSVIEKVVSGMEDQPSLLVFLHFLSVP